MQEVLLIETRHGTTSEKHVPLENFHPLSLIYCLSDPEAAGADTSLDDTHSVAAENVIYHPLMGV